MTSTHTSTVTHESSVKGKIGNRPQLRDVPPGLGIECTLDGKRGWGVAITKVFPGTLAARIGLRQGDVILHAGKTELKSPSVLAAVLAKTSEDSKLTLKLGNRKATITLTGYEARGILGVRTNTISITPNNYGMGQQSSAPQVRTYPPYVDTKTPAENAGLKAGDFVLGAKRAGQKHFTAFRNSNDLESFLKRCKAGESVDFKVLKSITNGYKRDEISIKLGKPPAPRYHTRTGTILEF